MAWNWIATDGAKGGGRTVSRTGGARGRPLQCGASPGTLVLLLLLVAAGTVTALVPRASGRRGLVVLSSLRIPPYERLVKAIQHFGDRYDPSVLYLDGGPEAVRTRLRSGPRAIVTVGREALRRGLAARGGIPLVYTMVLFPERILPADAPGVSGIAMVPSPRRQLRILHEGFRMDTVTLFYNPEVTGSLVTLTLKGVPKGMVLHPKAVHSEAEFLQTLSKGLPASDALLLVPDPTVLTEEGLKSLITSSYANGIPIVGFSPMYLKMGAAVTISVSERETAREAVLLATEGGAVQGEVKNNVHYLARCDVRVSRKAKSVFGFRVQNDTIKTLGTLSWSE